jgi:short-subunit dehydrogenase
MKGSISLVTGASSGLGKEIAELLCKKSHIVYAVARRKDKLLELQNQCKKHPGKIKIIAGDLTDTKFRVQLITQVLKETKKIDYLINNAGFGKLEAHEKIEYTDLEGMINLNILALQHLTQLVLPSMKKLKKGRIINISSIAAFEPPPYFATYNATKYAVHGFTKSLSYELKGTGVSTSVVFPSRMNTPFWIIAFKCKGLTGEEQKTCVADYTKKSSPALPVAKHIVKNLDTNNLLILPGALTKVAYHLLRHFKFIGTFFMQTSGVKSARKALKHQNES